MADVPEPTEPTAPDPPPNLRKATDDEHECEVCVYYKDASASNGKCSKYSNLPVDAEWLCDSFKRDTSVSDATKSDRDRKQPTTLRGAALIVKQHFAERRKAAEAAK